MSRLVWKTSRFVEIGEYRIPCSENLHDQTNQVSGIIRESKSKLLIRRISWPLTKIQYDMFVDGFIEWTIGKWIKEYVRRDSVFLEVGCGDMRLARYLPLGVAYNAFDLAFSEFNLRRALHGKRDLNVALASASDIPLDDDSVSIVVSTECFEEIPDINQAMREIRRICRPGAVMLCSIPNGFCLKYRTKGPHRRNFHSWSFDGFKTLAEKHGFVLSRSCMRGFWIPLPPSIVKTSYQLPITSETEHLNTNFFYVFTKAE